MEPRQHLKHCKLTELLRLKIRLYIDDALHNDICVSRTPVLFFTLPNSRARYRQMVRLCESCFPSTSSTGKAFCGISEKKTSLSVKQDVKLYEQEI